MSKAESQGEFAVWPMKLNQGLGISLERRGGEEMGGRFKRQGLSWLSWQRIRLPAVWETRVGSLGWEDPVGKGKATHCSVLACRIPCTV